MGCIKCKIANYCTSKCLEADASQHNDFCKEFQSHLKLKEEWEKHLSTLGTQQYNSIEAQNVFRRLVQLGIPTGFA